MIPPAATLSISSDNTPGFPRPTRCAIVRGWFVVFAGALILYALTANRGAQWQDSGLHIVRAVTHSAVSSRGLALSHPLHHYLARLAIAIHAVEPALAVTWVSALAGAICVANVFGLLFHTTGKTLAALFGCASLAFAETFWQLATLAESYTLCAALLAGECWCLILYARDRRPAFLCAALLLNGLGIANHLLASLTTPVLFVVLAIELYRKRFRFRIAAVAALLWIIGTLPYSVMIAMEWVRSGDFATTIRSALFGKVFAEEVLNTSLNARALALIAAFVVYSFPNLLLPAAIYGLGTAKRHGLPQLAYRALLAGLLIHLVFVLRYNIVDQHTFLLPLFVFLAIFGGIGFAAVMAWPARRKRTATLAAMMVLLALTPAVYAVAPALIRRSGVIASKVKHKPYRDDYVYLFTPWSVAETSANRLSEHAVQLASPDGVVILEDNMAVFAVQYRALIDGADSIDIIPPGRKDQIAAALHSTRHVVLVPSNTSRPVLPTPPGTSWRRVGDLYVLDR